MHNNFAADGPGTGEMLVAPARYPAEAGDPPSAGAVSVAHVTTSLDRGGAQTMLCKLVSSTAGGEECIRHSIVSLMRPGSMVETLRTSPCPIYGLDMRRGLPSPPSLLRLVRTCGAVSPDLVQGWMYHGNLAALAAGRALSVPVIWNVRHSVADLRRESVRMRILLRLSARWSRQPAAIIFNSRVSAAEHGALGFDLSRAVVIPNGFDCDRFSPQESCRTDARRLFAIADGPLVVAMVARHHPMKDHPMLISAIRQAREAGCDLHLLLVGPGIDAAPPELIRSIAAALPPDRVTLCGERADLDQWLATVDILALSSAWGEAFPNVLGEAMACAVPCVTTDVGDSAQVVGGGGAVVRAGDSASMAAELVRLARAGSAARQDIGREGRARIVREFELRKITHRYAQVYEGVLAGVPPVGVCAALSADSPVRLQ